jgi:hypothetical protein
MIATTGATTTEVIVVMITMMIVTTTGETTDVMIDVARTTTVLTTTTGKGADSTATAQRGQPQWCISESQPQDQLHSQWSPSDQKQPTDSIKHQGDRARQHWKPTTSAVV